MRDSLVVVLLGLDAFSSLLVSDGSSAIGGGDGVTDKSIIFEKFGLMHGLLSTYELKLASDSVDSFVIGTGTFAWSAIKLSGEIVCSDAAGGDGM